MNNARKLPDSYAKDSSSNNHKLLNLNEQAITALKKDMDDVLNVLDLSQATGATLDLYGDMVGQQRGELTDDQYRYMILTRSGINNSQGSYDSVIALLCRIFECEPSAISLDDGKDACTVELTKFPLSVLVNVGFSGQQAIDMIRLLLPSGVTIDSANFEGTFEFADTYGEYDETAGFGNIEQTIGGHLGTIANSSTSAPVLPV